MYPVYSDALSVPLALQSDYEKDGTDLSRAECHGYKKNWKKKKKSDGLGLLDICGPISRLESLAGINC